MADTTAVAIYKLGLDNQQYIQAAQTQISVSNQLVAAQERVAVSEEKAGGASLLAANAMQRRIEANTAGAREERKFAEAMAFSARAAQEGRATAEQRAIFLEQETAKLNTARAAIEAKAKAQRDAAQAEREAEAAAKNLARIEGEHALALKNVATALGQDQGALIAAANAGNRNAAVTLDMMNKIVGLNKALQEGKLNLTQHAKEVDLLQQGYRSSVTAIATQEAAMRKSSTVTGLARHELINLSRQFQDVFVSLAGGQSPFRVIIEQGSQILDVFASSKAAFGQVFSNLIDWAKRSATSIIGIATAAAALGVAAAVLAVQWATTQQSVERSLIGIGDRAGLTLKQVNAIAEAASKQGRLSVPGARSAAEEFIKTGKMYGETVTVATNITDKFALAMGVSAAEGAKQLAEILSDTDKGLQTLGKSFSFVDGKLVEQVRSLNAANKQQEAMLVVLRALDPQLTKAAEASSIWARAWMGLTGAMQSWIDKQGRKVIELIGIWTSVKDAVTQTINEMEIAFRRGQQFQLQSQPREGRERQGSPGRVAVQQMDQPSAAAAPSRVAASKEALDSTTESAQRASKALDDAAKSRDKLFGLEAEAAVNQLIPQIQQLKALEKTLNDVKRAQEQAAVRGGMAEGMAAQLQAAANAGEVLRRTLTETQETTARANAEVLKMSEAYGNVSLATTRILFDQQQQLDMAKAVTGQEKILAQEKATVARLIFQGVAPAEALTIAAKERLIAETQIATQSKLNVLALQDQLNVAKALPGHAQQMAQYEADINARLREGATLMQAEEEAAMKRAIAVQQANRGVENQIVGIQQQIDSITARTRGDEAGTAAANAYENAIRSGADATHAAAVAAKTLCLEEIKAADAAERAAAAMEKQALAAGEAALQSGKISANASELSAKLLAVGRVSGGSFAAGTGFARAGDVVHTQLGGGGPLVGAAGAGTAYNVDIYRSRDSIAFAREAAEKMAAAQEKAAQAAQAAASAAQAAADAQLQAADAARNAAEQQAEAAKAAREAYISQLDEAVKEIVATKLLAGQSAQAVNMLIEQGGIRFGSSSTRFQTQLDLYKRAGASNAQIAADIRAGIIGEGAKPSELLAALDSLIEAVNANTDAQLGLSPFYTSQGDRQLGYRGYTVQKGASNIPGTGTGGLNTGGTGGIPGTGIGGGVTPIGGIMGGVVNPIEEVSFQTQPTLQSKYNHTTNTLERGYFDANGQWVVSGTQPVLSKDGYWVTPGIPGSGISDTLYHPRTQYQTISSHAQGGIMSAAGPMPLHSYQDGGIAYGPRMAQIGQQIARFGEAGPEAFVPLKGGAIPVKLVGAANNNKPTNVININAPLVNFMAEPTRDEVRQSAFQASQMLRRQMAS